MPTPEEIIAELQAQLGQQREESELRLRQEQERTNQERERADQAHERANQAQERAARATERANKAEAELRARWVAYFEFLKHTCKMSCGAYYNLWFSF